MGNVSADGKQLWLSGRYDSAVYAIHRRRASHRQDPGGQRAARALRVAAARPLLPRPHRHHCADRNPVARLLPIHVALTDGSSSGGQVGGMSGGRRVTDAGRSRQQWTTPVVLACAAAMTVTGCGRGATSSVGASTTAVPTASSAARRRRRRCGAGWALFQVLVAVLTGVFDPPPAGITVPWLYLGGRRRSRSALALAAETAPAAQ